LARRESVLEDSAMPAPLDPTTIPLDITALRDLLLQREAEHAAELQAARAGLQEQVLRNEKLKLRLAKLLRARFGASSEKLRTAIEQLELILSDLEEQIAETAPAEPQQPDAPEPADTARRKPARRPLPENLPRMTVEHAAPCACPKCGGTLHRLGEAGQGSGGAAVGMPDEGRTSPRCWTTCRRRSVLSATCVRNCPAAAATASRKPRLPACLFTAAWPRQLCWHTCWWRNMPIIARCIVRRRSMRVAASSSIVPLSLIG
jgi:hypothetical protein